MPRLVDATLVLLREESACQQVESDGEIDDDDAEHDEVLMDAVSDLLPAFAKSMGSHFAPIFAKLFEPLMKFAVVCSRNLWFLTRFLNFPLLTRLTIGICRKLHALHKIGQWWLHALLKLLRTWVLQFQAMLM